MAAIVKYDISPYLSNGWTVETKFGTVMHIAPLNRTAG